MIGALRVSYPVCHNMEPVFMSEVMRPKDADGMANSADVDQTRFCIVFGNNCPTVQIFNVKIKELAIMVEGT